MDRVRREEVIIEADQLLAEFANPDLRVLDATVMMGQGEDTPDAHKIYTDGHIPGSVFFDHSAFSDPNGKYQLTLPDPGFLGAALGKIGISNSSEVVVYSTGAIVWATRVWWLLRYAGHNQVRVLNGGLRAWQSAGGEISRELSAYPEATFTVDPQPGYFVNKAEMEGALAASDIQMVNSLPQAAYDQAHIPQSVCQPCSDFLDNWSTLLPDAELKDLLVANHPTGQTIMYCGGGVAATLNAVVCRLVGNPNVAVYDGSMSEWTGEGMPVETANT